MNAIKQSEVAAYITELWNAFNICRIRHNAVRQIEKYRDTTNVQRKTAGEK